MKDNAREIIQKNTSDLIPYERNPRVNDNAVDKVANSIREFGFKSPIIIDEHNVIICGHTRLKAAKKLGLKEVPVIVARDLTDEQIKAYRLVDNKVSELAEWNEELLKLELGELGDLREFGFEELESADTGLRDDFCQSEGEVIYEPKQSSWKASDLWKYEAKFDEDIGKIKDKELKRFLQARAFWFSEFNFERIADYYAYQATPDEKRIFEKLGLVILDLDGAIENGFSNLFKEVREETIGNQA